MLPLFPSFDPSTFPLLKHKGTGISKYITLNLISIDQDDTVTAQTTSLLALIQFV